MKITFKKHFAHSHYENLLKTLSDMEWLNKSIKIISAEKHQTNVQLELEVDAENLADLITLGIFIGIEALADAKKAEV